MPRKQPDTHVRPRDLGAPDTDAGEEAKSAVDGLAAELEANMKTIEDALEGASGVSGILEAVSTITSTLSTMGSEVKAAITIEDLDARVSSRARSSKPTAVNR